MPRVVSVLCSCVIIPFFVVKGRPIICLLAPSLCPFELILSSRRCRRPFFFHFSFFAALPCPHNFGQGFPPSNAVIIVGRPANHIPDPDSQSLSCPPDAPQNFLPLFTEIHVRLSYYYSLFGKPFPLSPIRFSRHFPSRCFLSLHHPSVSCLSFFIFLFLALPEGPAPFYCRTNSVFQVSFSPPWRFVQFFFPSPYIFYPFPMW